MEPGAPLWAGGFGCGGGSILRGVANWIGGALLLAVAACGGRAAAGGAPPPPLDLGGVRVMVLPAQAVESVAGDVDAEIAFALRERGSLTAWVFAGELRVALARNPGLAVQLEQMPVGVFRRARVQRIGDPLYGELRRLAALSDATVALIPIDVRASAGGDGASAVEIAAALIEARLGTVLWYGIVSSRTGPASGAPPLAAAADALARALLR